MMANEIKNLRESLFLDQKQFGDLLGVSRTTISDWENNKKSPSLKNKKKLKEIKDKK